MNKCVFLDRDGVLNKERGTYTWEIEDFEIIPGVKESLPKLKDAGFLLIVVTNQAGITKGLFSKEKMHLCHQYLIEQTGFLIDDIYFSKYHSIYSNSLLRKPDSLMFEKAIAKYNIDPKRSWMVGDHERDLIPAQYLGMKTVFIGEKSELVNADFYAQDLLSATSYIVERNTVS